MSLWKEMVARGVEDRLFGAVAAWTRFGNGTPEIGFSGVAVRDETEPVGPSHRFDLASLTKPLATWLALVHLEESGCLDASAPVSRFLPGWQDGAKATIRIHHLLTHSAGLPAHIPYYERLDVRSGWDPLEVRDRAISVQPLEGVPGARTCYSDLGYMVLRRIVEKIADCPFEEVVEARVFPQWEVDGIGFLPMASGVRTVETGWSDWRRRVLHGEVHDDNAALVGGVDGHAGLFGTVEGVGLLCGRILRRFRSGRGGMVFRAGFDVPGEPCRRPQGWDRPSGPLPSCGPGFSSASVGHLGFTGTSVWCDPESDLVVVLLSNRVVYPETLSRMRTFRRAFHTAVAVGYGLVPEALLRLERV